MEMVQTSSQMETNSLDNMHMEIQMAMDNINGKMAINIQGHSKMDKRMERGNGKRNS
jgi:hypothetical protein